MVGMDDKLGEMPSLRPGGKTDISGIGVQGSDSGMNNFEMTIILSHIDTDNSLW